MILEEYLDRIGYREEVRVDAETLVALHKHHVLSVPFEDLDIHLGEPIKLELASIYEKVVHRKRGGFCYELNFLFCHLLKEIGFDGEFISARIYNEDGELGPVFDHMSIVVNLESKWLLDVGYGDLFIEPMKIEDNHLKEDWFKTYRIERNAGTTYLLCESKDGKNFENRYEFDLQPRRIEEFYDQCEFKQYSTESYFVKNRICTMPTKRGRTTLFNNKLVKRIDGLREASEVETELKFHQILREEFGIEITS